jgi:NaMN:DMB phosphoribosyltransferase
LTATTRQPVSRRSILLGVAAAVGGRKLAAIAGAILAARHHQIPVLLDGLCDRRGRSADTS